ncbi:MAG: tetratricopeptide repeat protein [Erythrobacter sp.]
MKSVRLGVAVFKPACKAIGTAACMASLGASALSAETLSVEGVYGSQVDIPSDIEVIAMENLGGTVGPDVALELSDALGSVYIEGQPYFQIVPAALTGASQVVLINRTESGPEQIRVDNPNAPDAVLLGRVRLTSQDRRVEDKVVKECIAKDDRGKCVEREEFRTRCDEFVMRLNPRIRLLAADGAQLYSKTNQRSETVRYCADEDTQIDADAMEEKMVRELISEIRADIAPSERREGIRIMESRKGLVSEDREPFRDAVRLTQNDPYGACLAFGALEQRNPEHVSVLFNIGLCHEGEGNLAEARQYYERALALEPDKTYPNQGINRIYNRERGEAQMAARNR